MAQHTPAPKAYATPTGSSALASKPSGDRVMRPNTANAIQTKSIGRRDVAMATASGPVNSRATDTPSGILANDR